MDEWEKAAEVDGLDVQNGSPAEECNSAEGGSWSSQASERTFNEWGDGPPEIDMFLPPEVEYPEPIVAAAALQTTSLHGEIEDFEKKHFTTQLQ